MKENNSKEEKLESLNLDDINNLDAVKGRSLDVDLNRSSLEPETKDIEGKIRKQREWIAGFLAIGVLVIFLIICILPIVYFFVNKSIPSELKDYLSSILPIMATLLGAAFGFYFSEKRF